MKKAHTRVHFIYWHSTLLMPYEVYLNAHNQVQH